MEREDGLWKLWGRNMKAEVTDAEQYLGVFDTVVMCDAMTANAGGLLLLHSFLLISALYTCTNAPLAIHFLPQLYH